MNFCETHILPHILDLDMKQPDMKLIRERLTPEAEGRVLEIGVGLGLNLPLYSDRARELIAIEPSPKLREMTKKHRRPRTAPSTYATAAPKLFRSTTPRSIPW